MPRTAPGFGETVKIGDYRVESIYLAFVADMLRKHAGRKKILHDLEDGVIRATPVEDLTGMPRGSNTSDQTGSAAQRLQDSREPTFEARAHLRTSLAAIEDVYNHLPTEQHDIIKEIYFKRQRTLLGVARFMNIPIATVCRKRNRALLAFAVEIIGEHILLPAREK